MKPLIACDQTFSYLKKKRKLKKKNNNILEMAAAAFNHFLILLIFFSHSLKLMEKKMKTHIEVFLAFVAYTLTHARISSNLKIHI